MKILIKLLIIFILIESSFLFVSCSSNFESENNKISLIVPLYSFPTDENGEIWNAVFTASQSVPIAVIWGLVDTADEPIYKQYTDYLQSSENISLYAYIATNSGQRSSAKVKKEVDYYVNHFNIDGIFFDEVSSEDEYIPYYKNLIRYAKGYSKIKKVILNSSYAPSDFLKDTGADILVIFENYGYEWDNFSKKDYISLSSDQKAIIVHSVSSSSQMKSIIADALTNHIGYVYVTDKEYDELPSYWTEEVNFIKQINENRSFFYTKFSLNL